MKRSIAILIWLVINIIFLSILRHYHKEYLNGEYVVKGRGDNARIITKQADPEYYQSRMKYMWMGYILAPVYLVVSCTSKFVSSRRSALLNENGKQAILTIASRW